MASDLKKEWYRYLIEVLVVILGIMGAFTLESWRDAQKEERLKQELYGDFIQELQKDLVEIEGNAAFNNSFLKMYRRASEIIQSDPQMMKADSVGILTIGLMDFSDFKKSGSAYEALSNSGKLDLIDNKTILYQLQEISMLYIYINRLESNQETLMFEVVPQVFEYISIAPFDVKKPKSLYTYQFNNIFQVFIRLGEEKNGLYEDAVEQLNMLIVAMKNELD